MNKEINQCSDTNSDREILVKSINGATHMIGNSKDSTVIKKLVNASDVEAYHELTESLEMLNRKNSKDLSMARLYSRKKEEIEETVTKIIDATPRHKNAEAWADINAIVQRGILNYSQSKFAKELKTGENIIYVINDPDFQISNKSVSATGTKNIFITSLGRSFAHDSGGFFTEESVTITNYPLELICCDQYVTVKPNSKDKVQFSYNMPIHKFINFYPQLGHEFKIENATDYISISNNNFDACSVKVIEDTIIINACDTFNSINLKHIEAYEQIKNLFVLKGYFLAKSQNKVYTEIKFFLPNKTEFYSYLSQITPKTLQFSKFSCTYISFTGEINGTFYLKEDAMISVQNDSVLFFSYNTIEALGSFKLSTMSYLIDKDKLFVTAPNIVIVINFYEALELDLSKLNELKADSKLNIGYTQNGQPFMITVENDRIILKQSEAKNLYIIKIAEVRNIVIKEICNEDSDYFIKASIEKVDNECIDIFICEQYLSQLIKSVFKNSKAKSYEVSNVQTLYTSWSRHVNDVLNYFYFGTLFIAKKEINEVMKKQIQNASEEDKIKIVNILYYAAQNQKKQLDINSVYYPKFLELQEKELMAKVDNSISTKQFKLLQKNLLGIGNQITRSLNEIERSLSQIPYVINTELNTRESMINTRYTQSFAVGAAGVFTTLVSGVFAPMLISSSLGFWNSHKTNKALEEVERKKLDIYMNQALDAFNHLINTMLPYYVNEVNESLFETLRITSKHYLNLDNSEIAKQILFERICDLYTFKQLPINDNLIVSKNDLIEEIHSSTNLSKQNLRNYMPVKEENAYV